jgi:hypothetical protein
MPKPQPPVVPVSLPPACGSSVLAVDGSLLALGSLLADGSVFWLGAADGSTDWLGSLDGSVLVSALGPADGSALGSVEVLLDGAWVGVSVPPERPSLTWVIVVPSPPETD